MIMMGVMMCLCVVCVGHFNILTAVVALSALETVSPSLPYLPTTNTVWEVAVWAFFGVFVFPLTLLAFTGNSWGNSVAWWMPALNIAPSVIGSAVRALRVLYPLR